MDPVLRHRVDVMTGEYSWFRINQTCVRKISMFCNGWDLVQTEIVLCRNHCNVTPLISDCRMLLMRL